ncbi:MAG: hypothetical protein R3B48_04820 [Kofleriaceae bacterium]
MSGSKSDGPRGFLGADDLDLDAWDATFDALHVPTESQSDQESEAPSPAEDLSAMEGLVEADDLTSVSQDAAPDDGFEPDPPSSPEDETRAVLAAAPAPIAADIDADDLDDADELEDGTQATRIEIEAEEVGDFEDVNTVELGEAVMLAEFHNFEEAARRASRRFAPVVPRESTRSDTRSEPATWPPPAQADSDPDVYTSAARPNTSGDFSGSRSELAPPTRPDLSPVPRTGRNVLARGAPPASANDFGAQESTRIAEAGELESGMSASRASTDAGARLTPTSMQAVMPPDDDYADIEIEGASSDEEANGGGDQGPSEAPNEAPSPPAAALAPAPARRTAHVLRRRGPLPKAPAAAAPFVAYDDDRDRAAPARARAPREEDDFSDIASEISERPEAPSAKSSTSTSSVAALFDRGARPSPPPRTQRVEEDDDEDDFVADGDDDATSLIVSETQADLAPAPETARQEEDGDEADPPTRMRPASTTRRPDFAEEEDPPTRMRPAPTTRRPGFEDHEDDEDDEDDDGPDDATAIIPLEPPPRLATPPVVAPRPAPAVPSLPHRVKTPTSVPSLSDARPAAAPRLGSSGELTFVELAAGEEPELDLEALAGLPEQLPPLPASGLDESFAQTLQVLEEDLETVDDREGAATLRLEAGRLAEELGETERARAHYDAAVLADPRMGAALRGLRRIAVAAGDLSGATRQLDAELDVASALERRPLGHYRADLLMAAAEEDLARVAVGEMLDAAPSDVRALIAQLELAYLDGRHDELSASLTQLAHAVSDAGLRAAAHTANAVLSTRPELQLTSGPLFLAAAADPSAMMSRLAAARHLVVENEPAAAAEAMTQVAFQLALSDKAVGAALAVRALLWGVPDGAVDLAASAAPADPIVAQTMVEAAPPSEAAAALSRCADRAPTLARRSYLAGLAAEIDPAHASAHWAHVLAADPGDDYAAAQLRTSHVASDATSEAIEVDLAASLEEHRERSRLRGGFGLAGLGDLPRAIEVLREGHAARPGSLPIAEALAEVYAQGGMWRERAELFAELAATPRESIDADLATLRSALAWEDAATAAGDEDATHARRQAVAAWQVVLEASPTSPVAQGALLALAAELEDAELLAATLARAHAVERGAWQSSSLAMRRTRYVEFDDEAESLLRDAATLGIDDPRRLTLHAWYAARRGELDDIATAYDDRARYLEDLEPPRTREAASLRLRAAQISMEAGDPARAATLFAAVGDALPSLSVVPDLLASARRRAGDLPVAAAAVRRATPAAAGGDEFARWVREGDYLAGQGDPAGALALYQRALELHPHDPLAAEPLRRLATVTGESAPIASLALGRLRNAEAAGDASGVAEAYQILADIDLNVRRDEGAALIALESAVKADPRRLVTLRQLAQLYASRGQVGDLLRIRRLQLEQISEEQADRAALLFDVADLAERDGRDADEVAEALAMALAIAPKQRLGLFQLEALVRRKGPSAQLADLEEQIAAYFEGDERSAAAFLTRSAETRAELGELEESIARFKRAEQSFPGHLPALRGWRLAALKGQLWLDVAESASREAEATSDPAARAELYHLAGVTLMDKALVAERAMTPLSRALAAEPGHRDAFLRLRILLEEDARHEDLATLLMQRLDVEDEVPAKVELHRALADLHRNFLSDRDEAKRHYRAILDLRPSDLHAHGALSDIAWELGEWADAAEALMARAKLEREPAVLRTLYYRLGLIYADRLPDAPAALDWLQKALQYDPDDDATLVRFADLAASSGEWKLALGACDRLVKNETDPARRVAHLHRVARIFIDGLGDRKRAERALNLALDGAPTNETARRELVNFYRAGGDATSIRIHLTRVAGVMRARVETNPRDAEAFQVLSRAMVDRDSAAAPGSRAVARIAAELATALGGGGEPERALLAGHVDPKFAPLVNHDADDLLFPRTVRSELRQMFHLLGDRLAKHVGIDLRAYGATRGERLRAKDSPVARVAQEVASGLGFGEIDVYIAPRMPWVYATEPTSPVSLILGHELATSEARVRFAASAALKLAAGSLSIAARLPAEELGVLVIALLRLFQPEFEAGKVDAAQVATQHQKLRRLIPTSLLNDLRPFALALDGSRLDPVALSKDLRAAGLRAGVVATQSVLPALELVAAGADATTALSDPLAADLLKFALGEDLVALSR